MFDTDRCCISGRGVTGACDDDGRGIADCTLGVSGEGDRGAGGISHSGDDTSGTSVIGGVEIARPASRSRNANRA